MKPFSPREAEVLPLLTEPNKVIARKLGIVEPTVKVYVKSILGKLGMRRRVEAAVWYADQQRLPTYAWFHQPFPPSDIRD